MRNKFLFQRKCNGDHTIYRRQKRFQNNMFIQRNKFVNNL